MVNVEGELVGLIFDGNLERLGDRFVYTDNKARAIAVDIRAIVKALTKVYGAQLLAEEMARAARDRWVVRAPSGVRAQ
jgi:hypothetical protein